MKVLWVDEEQNSLRIEILRAKARGWDMSLVEHVAGTLEMIEATRYDALVCDIILPADSFQCAAKFCDPENGYHLIETIRNPNRCGSTPSNVPILVVTADADAPLRLARYLTDVPPFVLLRKPVHEEAVTEAFRKLEEYCHPLREINDSSALSGNLGASPL